MNQIGSAASEILGYNHTHTSYYFQIRNINTSPEADVIKSLVVNTIGLVSILNQLMHRQGGVVGFHHSVRYLDR